jgi:hypothetical protein
MKVFDRVKKILETYPEARNSDNLCEWIYLEQIGIVENSIITRSAFMEAPPLESIRRARQLVQEKHPELQANDAVKSFRKQREEKFPRWVFDEATGEAKLI